MQVMISCAISASTLPTSTSITLALFIVTPSFLHVRYFMKMMYICKDQVSEKCLSKPLNIKINRYFLKGMINYV